MLVFVGLVIGFIGTYFVTKLWRDEALHRQILDIPNARSSHTMPTPRGGGVSIVIVFLVGVIALYLTGAVSGKVSAALAGGGALVAVVGFYDDRHSLSSRTRAVAHLVAAVWAVVLLGGFETINLGFTVIELGLVGDVLAAIGVVWLINLYNFMDGIDGIAGSETAFVGVTGGLLLLALGSVGLAQLAFLLAAASLGFLVWNWHPARIFMGDVGSGFLGYVIAVLILDSVKTSHAMTLFPWMILLGVFVVDTTITLLRRVARGEKWYEAHRSHAYQHATTVLNSHLKVTLIVIGINLVWLMPWALVAYNYTQLSVISAVVALTPLIAIALYLRAGQETRVQASPPQA